MQVIEGRARSQADRERVWRVVADAPGMVALGRVAEGGAGAGGRRPPGGVGR